MAFAIWIATAVCVVSVSTEHRATASFPRRCPVCGVVMRFGVECDAVVQMRMSREEFLENLVVVLTYFIQWKVEFVDDYIRKMISHIMASAFLLFAFLSSNMSGYSSTQFF